MDIFEVLAFVGIAGYLAYSYLRRKAQGEKAEAMFRSMFPDLQPYFHPAKLLDYVRARQAREPTPGFPWQDPPGFAGAKASFEKIDGRERVTLLDAAGTLLGQFFFEDHPEGGVLRVGQGKFTVNTTVQPRVRYWHPDREFKWSPRKGWTFQTRVAESSIDSSDRGTSWSSSSDSSASRAASVAPFAGAGGAFDGGGASQAWDGAERGGAGSSEGASSSAPAY